MKMQTDHKLTAAESLMIGSSLGTLAVVILVVLI